MEKEIYQERRAAASFRRKLILVAVAWLLGTTGYGGFLFYRHHHPVDQVIIMEDVTHSNCSHRECATAHEKVTRPDDYAPPLLCALLIVYYSVSGFVILTQMDV